MTVTAIESAMRTFGAISTLRPPDKPTGDPDVDKAVANYVRLLADLRAARTDLRRMEDNRKNAVDADKDAWATALAAGTTKDPGTPATTKADTALAVQRRKRDALSTATERAGRDLLALVAQHRHAITAHTDDTAATAMRDAAAALDLLDDALARHATAVAVARWATAPDRNYNETPLASPVRKTNGNPWPCAELVAAVRAALTPTPTPTTPTREPTPDAA